MLAAENVQFGYRQNLPAIANLSFGVEAGQHTLLLGPSGSGKTTLIYLICGFLTPTGGRILFEGEDIAAMSQAKRDAFRRRHIGIVFQTLRLISALSLQDNLLLAQKLAGRRRDAAAIAGLIDRLGLSARAKALPDQLSQGEAQRAAIARALIAQPKILIADEPTSALDDSNTAIVLQLLRETADASGATLLIATHDSRLKSAFSNTIHLGAA